MTTTASASALGPKGKIDREVTRDVSIQAVLTVTDIDPTVIAPPEYGGNVMPIIVDDDLVGWEVTDRVISGVVSNTRGRVIGDFAVTYSGTLTPEQAGYIYGALEINTRYGSIYGEVNGAIYPVPVGDPGTNPYYPIGLTEYGIPYIYTALGGEAVLTGGTGLYRGITGGKATFGTVQPLAYLEPCVVIPGAMHVAALEGSMGMEITQLTVKGPFALIASLVSAGKGYHYGWYK
jgi:hypothetical protein